MSRTITGDQIAALQKEAAVFAQRLDTQEKALPRHEQALDPHDLVAPRERQKEYAVKVDLLMSERDTWSRARHSVALLVVGGLISLAVQFALRSVGK